MAIPDKTVVLAALAARRNWQLVTPAHSDSVSSKAIGPSWHTASNADAEAVVVLAEFGDFSWVEDFLAQWDSTGAVAGIGRPPLVVALTCEDSDSVDIADFCTKQENLILRGADDVVALDRSDTEKHVERAIAMRFCALTLVRPGAMRRSGTLLSLCLSISDVGFETEDLQAAAIKRMTTEHGTNTDHATVTQETADEVREALHVVECGVNTDIVMDGFRVCGMRCTQCAKPPKLPDAGALAASVCVGGEHLACLEVQDAFEEEFILPVVKVAHAGAGDVCEGGTFDGRWVAGKTDVKPNAKPILPPAFRSMHISGSRVCLADGREATLKMQGGRYYLLGGEILLVNGQLICRGLSGSIVIFSRQREQVDNTEVAVIPRDGRRRAKLRAWRRTLLRRIFCHALPFDVQGWTSEIPMA